ncbi:WW domain-containing oxidoreductase [Ilyonectria destructans]|nr:WW domain-containing oxidoreductase [Ilyonectria destructans]
MSRYAESHVNPEGPGDARPTALQIIADEGLEGELRDKVVVITGTSSGLGVETARAMKAAGAKLFLTARDIKKARTVLEGIFEQGRDTLVEMDNTSLESVRKAAAKILESSGGKINILINNAGVMAIPSLQLSADGYELQFATNHISHFLLFKLLQPALLSSSTSAFQSRVIIVASSGHRVKGINASGNYNFENGGYEAWSAYGQSKTANVYMANEIERRFGGQGLHAVSLNPGTISTPLARHVDAAMFAQVPGLDKQMKSVEQGAATTVLAAVSKEWEGRGGKYLENCAETQPGEDDHNPLGVGYVPHTYDVAEAKRLWADSLKMAGFPDEADKEL